MDNQERFLTLCKSVERPGISDLLSWLNSTDFFVAPASTRYHGACPGGLLQHSLNVYDELKRILRVYPEIRCPEQSAVICPLFHDFCKINFYAEEMRNRKNEQGKWESYASYRVEEKFCYGGHGSKSVFIVQSFIDLTPEEAVAINCHMGAFDNDDVGRSYERYPLAWALHVADEAATYLQEGGN